MRVLLSCLQSPVKHAIPGYSFWRRYFIEGLKEAGVECLEVPDVDWAAGLAYEVREELEGWRDRTWQATLDFAREQSSKGGIDLFLGYLYPRQIEIQAIKEIEALGVPVVNFFCDNVREYRRLPEEFRPFSLHWVPEFEALTLYREAGLAHVHAPMPCWVAPDIRALPDSETELPTFLGSADPLRRDLLARAIELGAEIQIFGSGWSETPVLDFQGAGPRSPVELVRNQVRLVREHGWRALARKVDSRLRPFCPGVIPPERMGPSVSEEEYVRRTREAVVTIGINRVPTARASFRRPLRYSRLRDIEAPMMGACYLTEWTEGLSCLYEPGREIETYRTSEEMFQKIEELRRDPPRRRLMRTLAQSRALTDHSVARSLERICGELGLSAKR